MKKCPFCAEEIQVEAIKCRYCGEFLDGTYKPNTGRKWYYTNTAIVVGLVTLGPLALPLVWKKPQYTLLTKSIITIIVIVVTIWLCWLTGKLYQNLIEQMKTLGL